MEVKISLPLLPLRDIVVFPNMIVPLFVGRIKSIKALEFAEKNDKEIFLNGQIRAGRTSKVKKQLILGLRKILIKNTKLQSDFIWVYLEDLLPDQMIEYGEVLPKSGQEKKWFNSLSPSLKKRLKKIEKN